MFTNIAKAAVAAVLTMALGAFALYATVGWAQIGFDGDGKVGPFLVGLLIAAIIGGGVAALRHATSERTSDDEGFAIGIAVLIVAIVATITMVVWAIGGWDWGQFWLGTLVLGLWAAATGVHIAHKYMTD